MLLQDKVALITGAGKGIGREIAVEMAREGAKVVIADISETDGQTVCQAIKEEGGEAFFTKVDISKFEDVVNSAESAVSAFGKIDILVCNAGITFRREFLDLTPQEVEKIVTINLKGTFHTVKGVLPHLLGRGQGRIIVISSSSAITGSGGGAHYAATKAGQNGLVRSLAKELGPRGITVNAVAPRVISGEILDHLYPPGPARDEVIQKIPVRRVGTPADIAGMTVYLATDQASYVNGQIILLDGGRTYS
jgi:3-oxoacyl-[acyl-carrier protein] reductase